MPRPRAPRLLRLVDNGGAALKGDCFEPRFDARGKGLFFERNGQNTRELWFATPLVRPGERYPAWRAARVLAPKAPLRLGEAVSLKEDDSLFVAVGANKSDQEQLPAPDTQLLLVKAKNSAVSKTLWSGRERLAQLAPSPDARTIVFTRYFQEGRRETPQLWFVSPETSGAKPTLLLKNARRAFWLDSSTLVFERVADTGTAFYTLNPFTSNPPQLLLQGSGEGAALGAGVGIVFAARSVKNSTTSLYMLARDGSGLRSIADSEGARHPAISRDGQRLAFDAPDPRTGSRALWLLTFDQETPSPLNPASFPLSIPSPGATCQLEPMPLPPPAPPAEPVPGPVLQPTPKPTPFPTPTPAPKPVPTPTKVPPSPNDDRADIDVAGTLANVPPGGKMRVTLWAKNRGTRNWTPDDVRIVVRWIDFDSGTRRRWSFNWMRGVVPPLGQVRVPIDLVAPTRKGRYKVIYSLMRLPAKGAQVTPPPFDVPQDVWPGEFAATAFAVNVNAPATPAPN